MFKIVEPFSFISFPLWPYVLSHPLYFVILVFSLICASIRENFESVAMSLIVLPVPLVSLSAVIEHDAFALPVTRGKLSVVDCFFILFEFEGRRSVES